jgi:hypothetical protein
LWTDQLVPALTKTIQPIQIPLNLLVDKDALGKISIFGLEIIVVDFAMEYPTEGNQFIMQIFFEIG